MHLEGARPLSRSITVFLLIALAIPLAGAGCSSPSVAPTSVAPSPVRTVTASEAVAMLEDRVVIDVRTPEEFAQGHLAEAVNIPVEAADFGERIDDLDHAGAYLVYCRSGRRSAIAADVMAKAGFTDVVDAGGMEPLVVAGAPLA
jgi:phage shock protein E